MLGRTDSRRRLLALLVLFIVGSAALVTRTAYWQVVRGAELTEKAEAQTTVTIEVPSRRGEIYDRTGTVLLATSVDRDRLVAAPDQLTPDQATQTADELEGILALDEAGAATLRERLDSDKAYVVLAHGIEPDVSERIRQASRAERIFGISLESEPERVYPQAGGGPDSSLAAHLLGFVNRENVGQYGVEQYYQDLLAGTPRVVVASRDINGRAMPETAQVKSPGSIGEDLTLTIDASLQLAVEQELLAAWIADKAKSASAVVMDPYTGEVYAEATYPSYDANHYRSVAASAPERFMDPVVANVYEPGSVFKLMTATSALEAGTVTRTTKIKDVGTLRLDGGRTKIDNADRKGMGRITFEDGIAYSRNVVAAKVALSLGDTLAESSAMLYDTWTKLGYGNPTGIDVAGEVGGIVRDPGITPWREIDLANAAFGQGVAVTPIQLATAYSALLNGGTLVEPHVVKTIGVNDVSRATRGYVVDPAVLPDLIRLMEHVVEEVPFYRERTQVPGYYVGGKTGTAQIWDVTANDGRGAWKHNLFNYSFIGYIAREKGVPDLVVAVRIEEGRPTVARVGQLEMPVMSFELFRRIASDAMATPDLLTYRPASLHPTPADR
ncbi:MAG: penicillin-binding protein 2 [Chloroflexota bacterium]|jgi:cell division protein FtsI/penicillin-binding protein 2|nr:penicillin-binding protein 2 [Chloroflexota bacterium]